MKHLPEEITLRESGIPWRQFAGFRDVLAHSYFAVDLSVLWEAAEVYAKLTKKSIRSFYLVKARYRDLID